MLRRIYRFFDIFAGILFFPFWIIILLNLLIFKFFFIKKNSNILVFSWHPITMYATLATSLKKPNRIVHSVSKTFYPTIQTGHEWDILIDNSFRYLPLSIKLMIFYVLFIKRFDVFILSCDGFLFGLTPLKRFEKLIFSLFDKKTIVIPYGGDSYIYNRVSSSHRVHGLQISYPAASRDQKNIASRVDYWIKHADLFIPGMMSFDGFGRWDVLLPSTVFVDTQKISSSHRHSLADGINKTVYVTHSPNHRGVKGTQFIVNAVKELQIEGLKVELMLNEGIQNSELMKVYQYESDIHVEQLLLPATGINGIEAMAAGLPVVSNTEPSDQYQLLRDFSYFDECPIFSANPSSIKNSLKTLITNPSLRLELGKAGREYVEKYQSFASANRLFDTCLKYLQNNGNHPQSYLDEFMRDHEKINNPLQKN